MACLASRPSSRPVLGWSRQPHADTDLVRWHQVDITDKEAVAHAIARDRPAWIAHLAGSPHVGQSWKNSLEPLRTNVLGTHHLLEAVRRHSPASRVLIVTSAMIYQPGPTPLTEDSPRVPVSPYGLAKLAQDELALLAAATDGLDIVVARPFNHIGPGQDPGFAISSFARQIARIEAGLADPVVRVGNLDAERDLMDVRDTVRAYAALLERGTAGRAYNICSGTTQRIGDCLDHLISIATVSITRATDPDRLRPSDVPRLVGDASRLRQELGWTPTRSLDDTLADTLQWWRRSMAAGEDAGS